MADKVYKVTSPIGRSEEHNDFVDRVNRFTAQLGTEGKKIVVDYDNVWLTVTDDGEARWTEYQLDANGKKVFDKDADEFRKITKAFLLPDRIESLPEHFGLTASE